MARQSLYELLGLTDKASPDEIRRAFDAACANLDAETDGEHQRNRLTFLAHARDTLLDPRLRALHDRDIWGDRRAQENTRAPAGVAAKRRWFIAGGFILLLALLVSLAKEGLHPVPDMRSGNLAKAHSAAQAILPKLADIAAQIPDRDMVIVDEPIPATPVVNAVQAATTEPLPVNFLVPNSPVFDKIIGATYAIVGTQMMGTGVVIEKDRLLTNCHVLAPNVLKGKIYAISAKNRDRFEITEAAFLVKEDACVALAPGLGGEPIVMGETRSLRAGARFFNLGFADGTLTLSDGLYLGSIVRSQQSYLVSTNYCVPGVSGGALIDDDGRLLGITSGSTPDHRYCASLTAETARSVLAQSMIPIDAFPTHYLTNFKRRW